MLIAIVLCASRVDAQIDYVDMRSLAGLQLVGTAMQSDSVIDINGFAPKLAGGLWHFDKQHVARGFTTSFRFQITDTSGQDDAAGATGGDGFAFVIQNSEPAPLGGSGGRLGYDAIKNSIAIEFDTYHNDEPGFGDPNGNHIAVHTTGTGNNSASHSFAIASNTRIPNLSDGRAHTVTIVYTDGGLTVYLDDCRTLLLGMSIDIASRIALDNGRAWIGFTASTGSAWERHTLHAWRFNARPTAEPTRVGLCAGNSARLSPSGRFNSYQWSTGATTPSIDVSAPGRYSVDVTDTLGCTRRDMTFVFDVVASGSARPKIAATKTLTLCPGGQIILDGGDFASRQWSNGSSSRTITVTTPGTYWLSVRDSLGCSGSDTVTVIASPRPATPVISIVGRDRFCSGDSAVLDAGPGYASYRWTNGATTQRITVRDGGTYTVIVSNAAGCLTTSSPFTITVLPRPYPVVQASGPTRFCSGGSLTLDAGAGYSAYRWSNGATTSSIVVDSSGTYFVTVTGANGCTGTSSPIDVEELVAPEPVIVADETTRLCHGDSIVLRTRLRYSSYAWSTGSTDESIVVMSNGDYSVRVVDSTGCEGASRPHSVAIDTVGAFSITASGPARFCKGEVLSLSAPVGLVVYRWSNGATTRSIDVTSSGTYYVAATDSSGCTASDSITVTVSERVAAHVSADVAICDGASARLDASGAQRYSWTPIGTLDCYDCARPLASPTTTTRYQLIASSDGMCSDTSWTTVTVLPSPRLTARAIGEHFVLPGRFVEVPVVISGETSGVTRMTIDLAYGSSVAILRAVVLGNDMLTGWQMQTIVDTPGLFRASFASSDGRALRDGQTLLTMRMQTYMGNPARSTVQPTLTLMDQPCASVELATASITIDSLCGMSSRLIESYDPTLVLQPSFPNPFNPLTHVRIENGFTSVVTLAVSNAAGERVALLHDGPLDAGTHGFVWDASSMPSGLYMLQAHSGERYDRRALLLVK